MNRTPIMRRAARWLTLTAVAAAALGVGAAPASAAGTAMGPGSILYAKGGKLWVTSPDGARKRRVAHAGQFENPSQADSGLIVAQRGFQLYRVNRLGRLLGKPITTAFRTNPILPAFQGPFWPEVSPDGTRIAYTYSFTAARFDYGCMCSVVSPSLNVSYTWAGRFVDDPVSAFGLSHMYAQPSWIDNRSVVMATLSLFDFAGNVLNSVAVDTVGGGEDSHTSWFTECDPCDSLETLRLYRVEEPEMTRQKDKLVVTAGDLGGAEGGRRLLIYRVGAMPPALPAGPCHVTGASGRFSSPSWSPDGRSLAWADSRGVWVGRVGDLSGSTCQLTRRLVVPGGSQPDWGPAAPAKGFRR